ncbi:MAG: lytic transglycosylase domain-containing protein [Blastocatellales bacterium]|nr:lytic transglycosylase domain-containing protein [Blastocatellales bacterium]
MIVTRSKNLLPPILLALIMLNVVARADELHLKNGRVIQAEEVGEVGDYVWYRQGKVTTVMARAEVERVVYTRTGAAKPSAVSVIVPQASAAAAPVAAPAPVAEPAAEVVAASAPVRPHIMLRSGARIDADEIWENAERVRYRLGNIQGFIEREEIASLATGAAGPDVSASSALLDSDKADNPARGGASTGHAGLDTLIARNAARHGVDPMLIYYVMREESGFNRRAVSRAGARGLMQLMPDTARRFGVRDIHDPAQNIEAGTKYLKTLLGLFDGDVKLALAAYNAGEGTVLRYGRRIPPYAETRNYVRRILASYQSAR